MSDCAFCHHPKSAHERFSCRTCHKTPAVLNTPCTGFLAADYEDDEYRTARSKGQKTIDDINERDWARKAK